MAEFKKLSAVEAVESISDTANVLIEEGGVIKKAPKDEIGGGIKVASTAEVGQTIVVKAVNADGMPTEWECADLGVEPDLVINIKKWTQTIQNDGITASDIAIESGSLSNVYDTLRKGKMPVIKIKHYYDADGTNYSVMAEEYTCCYFGKYDMSCEIYYMNICGVSTIRASIDGDQDVLLSYQLGPNFYNYSSTSEVPLT